MLDQDQNSGETAKQSSQFVGGLVMGLVLGTAGYYFFGTPEGKKQRQVLLSKWTKFGAEISQKQAHSKSDLSEILHSGIRRLASEFGLADWQPKTKGTDQLKAPQPSKTALVSSRFKPKSSTVRAKFHGI